MHAEVVELMRGQLQRLGIFRQSGHEHLSGSLVIPIVSAHDVVQGLYGRKITAGLREGPSRIDASLGQTTASSWRRSLGLRDACMTAGTRCTSGRALEHLKHFSYLVARPLQPTVGHIDFPVLRSLEAAHVAGGGLFSHMFIVTNARYLGDAEASIYSYGVTTDPGHSIRR